MHLNTQKIKKSNLIKIPRRKRFLLNWFNRILAKGRPRTYKSRVGDEELDQISRVADSS